MNNVVLVGSPIAAIAIHFWSQITEWVQETAYHIINLSQLDVPGSDILSGFAAPPIAALTVVLGLCWIVYRHINSR